MIGPNFARALVDKIWFNLGGKGRGGQARRGREECVGGGGELPTDFWAKFSVIGGGSGGEGEEEGKREERGGEGREGRRIGEGSRKP